MRPQNAVFLSFLFLWSTSVFAATLTPGEIAQYTFTTDPISSPCPGTCDTLFFSAGYTSLSGAPTLTASLFDGTTLLGTFTSATFGEATFLSSGSLLSNAAAPVVDFTNILNGTIDGIIELSVSGGGGHRDSGCAVR